MKTMRKMVTRMITMRLILLLLFLMDIATAKAECKKDQIVPFIIRINPYNIGNIIDLSVKFSKKMF